MDDFYEANVYEAPRIVDVIGAALRAPRKYHSTNFTDVVSPDLEVQLNYAYGLLTVLIIILVLYTLWVLILVVLKLKGSQVGCASGQAFLKENVDDGSDIGSTALDDDYHTNSLGDTDSRNGLTILQHHIDRQDSGQMSTGFESYGDYDSRDGWLPSFTSKESRLRISKREKRTRFAFLLFSCMALVSVPMILVFSFGEMKEATRYSDAILSTSRDVLAQVQASLNTVAVATDDAKEIVAQTPIQLSEVCPYVDEGEFKEALGMNLNDLTQMLESNFDELTGNMDGKISRYEKILSGFESGMNEIEENVDYIEDLMWIVPGLLFAVSMVASIAMLAVLLAWREKSGRAFQRSMSYVFLPLLILLSIGCWAVLMFSALGTMISSDICTAGSPGSPDNMIQSIIAAHFPQDDVVYKLVNAYTNGCTGSDPVADIKELEGEVQDVIDAIWRQISIVDSLGRNKLIAMCGGNNLVDLLNGARNLAKLLTAIRRALDSASGSLQCDRINPIYTEAAHNTLCTNVASASAYGFILFFVLAIATMVMISLRASWLRDEVEEKVYHDESEVAENMILDEHEEYLAYISKYKHEWQEYRGFDSSLRGSDEDDIFEDESADSLYYDEDEPEEDELFVLPEPILPPSDKPEFEEDEFYFDDDDDDDCGGIQLSHNALGRISHGSDASEGRVDEPEFEEGEVYFADDDDDDNGKISHNVGIRSHAVPSLKAVNHLAAAAAERLHVDIDARGHDTEEDIQHAQDPPTGMEVQLSHSGLGRISHSGSDASECRVGYNDSRKQNAAFGEGEDPPV